MMPTERAQTCRTICAALPLWRSSTALSMSSSTTRRRSVQQCRIASTRGHCHILLMYCRMRSLIGASMSVGGWSSLAIRVLSRMLRIRRARAIIHGRKRRGRLRMRIDRSSGREIIPSGGCPLCSISDAVLTRWRCCRRRSSCRSRRRISMSISSAAGIRRSCRTRHLTSSSCRIQAHPN